MPALISAVLAIAVAFVATACGGDTRSAGTLGTSTTITNPIPSDPPQPSSLILVVNPSKRVHALVFRHATEIIKEVARPNLNVVGIYEQRTTDDGPPFDRAFLEEPALAYPKPPRSKPRPHCTGPGVKKTRCIEKWESAHAQALGAWERDLATATDQWRDRVLAKLANVAAAGHTEESPTGVWNLRGALENAGHSLVSLDTPIRCVVLLGGLAVRQPPPHLEERLLGATTVIAAGWRGTVDVQQAWEAALASEGAKIEFLTEAVTDLRLVRTVKECLGDRPPSADGS